MPRTTNPLRYPGAKRQLVPYIKNLLICNNLAGCTFYEPYAGSAAVGLELLQKSVINKLVLIEKDVLIYSFWKCVFNYPDDLCERIENSPITIETWHSLTPFRDINIPNEDKVLELGFAGLFFNRTNFSGILSANPIGGINQSSAYSIDCRFNKPVLIELIQKLSNLRSCVEVHWGDAIAFMKSEKKKLMQSSSFVYFDPPYYEKGKQMYRHFYTNKDHKTLAAFVKENKHFDWLISYDDASYICGLYSGSGAKYCPFYLDYSVAIKTRTKGKELLISNLPLPPLYVSQTSNENG